MKVLSMYNDTDIMTSCKMTNTTMALSITALSLKALGKIGTQHLNTNPSDI